MKECFAKHYKHKENNVELGKAINYTINIRPTSNHGFIVKVGCGTFAFSSKEELLGALTEFLNDPKILEDEYNKSCAPHPMDTMAEVPNMPVEETCCNAPN